MALGWSADLYRRIMTAGARWETFLQNLRPTVDHQNDARPPGSARSLLLLHVVKLSPLCKNTACAQLRIGMSE